MTSGEANRKNTFEAWFSKYGPSFGKYLQALNDPHYVINFRKTSPSGGQVQAADFDLSIFPKVGQTLFSLYSVKDVKAVFHETREFRVGDDGAMHTAIGYYALWLRCMLCEEWRDELYWEGDCTMGGKSSGRTRLATLLKNGFDYKNILSIRKATYKMDKTLAAIRTKPFILLAGISGTGKSRLVRQLARGCCPKKDANGNPHPFADEQKPGNFEIIAVRPNWHDSTELMGFESRIPEPTFVIKPFVEFLVKAWMNPDIPFFFCLDEMNLAPVEQYFAEYLSAIESRKEMTGGGRAFFKTDVMVKMGAPEKAWDPNGTTVLDEALKKLFVPYAALLADQDKKDWGEFVREMFVKDGGVSIPPNLVVMGTVNMDETTCSFSRKVLDRAMSFELNDVSDMYDKNNLAGEKDLDFGCLGHGVTTCTMLTGAKAYAEDNAAGDTILGYLKAVNDKMEGTPFKIAYRSRNEIMIYCLERIKGGIDLWKALDEATSMKILSRIEGDEQKFIHFKLRDFRDVVALELCKIENPAATKMDADAFIADPQKGGKSISLAKLQHMSQALADGAGFVSFWE